ncbi:Flp pilus assembly complex ATPase component TadA [Myxococcota bacterium]|nr:Flp pilus assembly complex ATPase component TadA [Myxococcota bacterium]
MISNSDADTAALARSLGLPTVDLDETWVDSQLLQRITRAFAERRLVLPLHRGPDGRVHVAMANPGDLDLLSELESSLAASVRPFVASAEAIRRSIYRHFDLATYARDLLRDARPTRASPTFLGLELDPSQLSRKLRDGGAAPYVDLLNALLLQAVERRASDVHIEPGETDVRVRLRVDGMLREVLRLERWAAAPLVSRVKIVARMDVADTRRPQDGKATANLGEQRLDLRVSTLPGQHGEKAVIRLLDPSMLRADLGKLGWHQDGLQTFYHLVSKPQGLVLVVGPTGSGKSTTLYATLVRLNAEHRSIVTVEDPVEYVVPGVTQVQVNPKIGVDFAAAIRSVLRQDPNVLVIGEVRDHETAEAVFHAANTGHLVLSTLHTTGAVSSITRLLDLQVAPWLVASTLSGVVSQRLVRKVCPHCSVVAAPQEEDFARLNLPLLALGPKVRRAGKGCPACQLTGYSGRIAVFELLEINEDLRELIAAERPEGEIWRKARTLGLVSMAEDALRQVAEGATTLEEIARAVVVEPYLRKEGVIFHVPGTEVRLELDRLDRGLDPFLRPEPAAEAVAEPAAAPTLAEPATSEPAPTTTAAEPAGPPMVLVVDDAWEIRMMVEMALERDYRVLTAADGDEALAMIRLRRPDLVVLDVMMPNRSGYEVCAELKGAPETAELPVLLLSARGEKSHVKEGFYAGADDYLPKPFDPEELILRIKALLRRAGRL